MGKIIFHLALATFLLNYQSAEAEAPAIRKDFTVCYFSLNSETEFHVTKKFMDKLNKSSLVNIQVKEFMPEKGKPNQEFKKMVESGQRCDGLVISGHHTGNYGGLRADGKLMLDTIESLSCDPKYADWFRNVNAIWLQGCRTLGIGQVVEDTPEADPDYHTNRVGQVLEEDGLDDSDDSFTQLNMEFTSTLDQDNPLSSRYLRLFPSSKVFGWTKSAPGVKAKSEYSILYHMAHMSRVMDAEDKFPESRPHAENWTAASTAKYATSVLAVLNRYSEEQKGCNDLAVNAWMNHGRMTGPNSFDNADINGFSPLLSSGENDLLEAKEIDCLLKAAAKKNDAKLLNQVFDRLQSKPEFLRYSFNTLIDLRKQLANSKSPLSQVILQRMSNNPAVEDFLNKKLNSKQAGVLRKIDYYQFARAIGKERNVEVEQLIKDKARFILVSPLPTDSERSRKLAMNYRATLFNAIKSTKIADSDFFMNLLPKETEHDVLEILAGNLHLIEDKKVRPALFYQIASHPNATERVGNALLNFKVKIENAKDPSYAGSQEYGKLYWEIIGNASKPGMLFGKRPAWTPPPAPGTRQAPSTSPIGTVATTNTTPAQRGGLGGFFGTLRDSVFGN